MSRKLNPKWDVVVQKVAAVVHPVDKVHLYQTVMLDARPAATHRQSPGSQHLALFPIRIFMALEKVHVTRSILSPESVIDGAKRYEVYCMPQM